MHARLLEHTCSAPASVGDHAVRNHAFGAPALSTLKHLLYSRAKITEKASLLLCSATVAHHVLVAGLFCEVELILLCSDILHTSQERVSGCNEADQGQKLSALDPGVLAN